MVEWRLYAVAKQAELLDRHKIHEKNRNKLIAQKTLKCTKSCIKICVNSLRPNDAKKEISEIIQLLKKWAVIQKNILDFYVDDVFARAIADENIDEIYICSKRENKRGLLKKKVKVALNRMLGKFIERIRDNLKK